MSSSSGRPSEGLWPVKSNRQPEKPLAACEPDSYRRSPLSFWYEDSQRCVVQARGPYRHPHTQEDLRIGCPVKWCEVLPLALA